MTMLARSALRARVRRVELTVYESLITRSLMVRSSVIVL